MAISIKSTSGPNPVPENSKPSPKPETHPRKRGDGYIYQREGSGNWWICYYFRGKPHQRQASPGKLLLDGPGRCAEETG